MSRRSSWERRVNMLYRRAARALKYGHLQQARTARIEAARLLAQHRHPASQEPAPCAHCEDWENMAPEDHPDVCRRCGWEWA